MQESKKPPPSSKSSEDPKVEVANYSRQKAFSYLRTDNPGRALAHFNVALSLMPDWKADLKIYFMKALSGGCRKLEEEGKFQTSIDIRQHALTIYPENEAIICDTATLFFQLGNLVKASELYQLSLTVNPNFLPAYRALQTIKSVQLERWHFRMLNDVGRNKSYWDAITLSIQGGHHLVLDIGAGAGLLSLYAAHEGAKHIFACEVQNSIFNLGVCVIEANKCKEKVTLINKMSTDLKVPDDIPQKVSLVITEIFDAALLGEGILQALIHAWDNLLLLPGPNSSPSDESNSSFNSMPEYGSVIPQSATVWVAAVQCIDIARRYRLLPSQCLCRKELLMGSNDQGISFGGSILCNYCEAPISPKKFLTNKIRGLCDSVLVKTCLDEPYDVESLEVIPYGFKFLTKPYNLLHVNFNSLEDLKSHLNGGMIEHFLKADEGGSVDAMVSWFQLHLDGSHSLSTAPFQDIGHTRGWCWHQAVFPCLQATSVLPGQTIIINHNTSNGVLKINPHYEKSKDMNVESENIDSFNSCDGESRSHKEPHFCASSRILTFLNNRTWIQVMEETADVLFRTLCSVSPSSYQILDFYPFPIIGLEILKLSNTISTKWKLFVFTETTSDAQYIIFIAEKYGIKAEQIEFFSDLKWIRSVRDREFDIINLSLTDSSGEMCEKMVDCIPDLRTMLSPTGVITPYSVAIEGQIIESDWLLKNSMVTADENVGGFNVAKFVNNFVVDSHLDLNLHGIPHRPLSAPLEVLKLLINTDGRGSICTEEEVELVITPLQCGTSAGFVYWMKQHLLPEMISLSTFSYDSHCSQVVSLSSMVLCDKSKVVLKLGYYYGLMKFELRKQESQNL